MDDPHRPELVHEDDPRDPAAWQRPETLAATLGVSVRTLRNMVRRGDAERLKVAGRVYYRARPEATGSDRQPEGTASGNGHQDEGREARLLALLDAHRAELTTARAEALAEARRAAEARAAAERARGEARELAVLADVAARDVERARHELDATRAALATARLRARTLERYAGLPWYAMRQRRELRAMLAELEDAPPGLPDRRQA